MRILKFAFPPILLATSAIALLLWGDAIAAFVQKVSPGCMSKKLLHLECPGCGGTRAFCALAHGDIIRALQLNCWWIPTGFILAQEYAWAFCREFFPEETFPRWSKVRLRTIQFYAAGTLGFMILRNLL